MRLGSGSKLAILLLFAFTAGSARAETDLAFGAMADVAPFGIEHLAPELAAAFWFGEGAVRAGILAEASAWGPRSDLSASLCALAGNGRAAAFCGAGLAACRDGDCAVWPALSAGLRLGFGSLSLLPAAGLRLKRGDTDLDLRLLIARRL